MLGSTLLLFTWMLGGNARSACTVEGADTAVTLRCPALAADKMATAAASQPAEPLRGRRVTLSGELQAHDVAGGASLWLRVDANDSMLLLDNGIPEALTGTKEWTRRSVTLPVPSNATRIVFGVLLRGGGVAEARNVRIESVAIDSGKPMSKEAQAELDAAIAIVRKNALRRDNLDWKVVEPDLRMIAAGAQTASDVYPAIRYLLSALRDRHSILMPPAVQKARNEVKNPPLEVRALGDGVGYVKVPGFSGNAPDAVREYTRAAHQSLAATAASAKCGWIVDLRANPGGNMWPMLAALRPFLGDAAVGTFVPAGNAHAKWFANRAIDIPTPPALRPLLKAKVAVLTSPRTASSGEGVVVAFRGREQTRFFGEPTAGLSTANSSFPLPDGASIALTTAIYADRTGKEYGAKIEPDEVVKGEEEVVAAATRWLRCEG